MFVRLCVRVFVCVRWHTVVLGPTVAGMAVGMVVLVGVVMGEGTAELGVVMGS